MGLGLPCYTWGPTHCSFQAHCADGLTEARHITVALSQPFSQGQQLDT